MNPEELFCLNLSCPARGQAGKGKIGVHSEQEGRCICYEYGKTFAATKGTIFYRLRTDPEIVMIVIVLLSYQCPFLRSLGSEFHLSPGSLRNNVATWQRGRPSKQIQTLVDRWCS